MQSVGAISVSINVMDILLSLRETFRYDIVDDYVIFVLSQRLSELVSPSPKDVRGEGKLRQFCFRICMQKLIPPTLLPKLDLHFLGSFPLLSKPPLKILL